MKSFFNRHRWHPAVMLLKFVVWATLVAVVVWLVMLLWNWLMPAVFSGARTIDYWQTLGLIVLSRVFFGGGHGRWKGRRRWENMSADERAKLARFGRGGRCAEATSEGGQ
jgi:hypothetical protein